MKRIMIFTMAALLSVAFQQNRAGAASDVKPELTVALLSGTKWGPEHQAGKYVTFKSGGVYEGWEDFLQDGVKLSGSYAITGGALNLADEKRSPFLSGGALKADAASLRFTRYLIFDGGVKLWDLNSKVAAGKNVTASGVKAVAMGVRSGVVTMNAKLRSGPSHTAPEMTFERFKESGEMDTEKLAFLPAGTTVVILARTERKMKVQQWENYWFYIEVEEPIDHWKSGWVFAEFIKPQ